MRMRTNDHLAGLVVRQEIGRSAAQINISPGVGLSTIYWIACAPQFGSHLLTSSGVLGEEGKDKLSDSGSLIYLPTLRVYIPVTSATYLAKLNRQKSHLGGIGATRY